MSIRTRRFSTSAWTFLFSRFFRFSREAIRPLGKMTHRNKEGASYFRNVVFTCSGFVGEQICIGSCLSLIFSWKLYVGFCHFVRWNKRNVGSVLFWCFVRLLISFRLLKDVFWTCWKYMSLTEVILYSWAKKIPDRLEPDIYLFS